MTQGGRPGIRRRSLLVGALGALVPATGCGIRLEDDAPRLPLVPTRSPVPAQAELVALTRDTAALADLAATVPGALAADLARIHRDQHAVLRSALLAGGVPAATVDAVARPTPASTPSPSARAARAGLARAEAASAATASAFAGVAGDLRASVASLHAQRYAAATLLAGRAPTVPQWPLTGDGVRALAAQTAAAVYFLEVVSARSTGGQRTRSDTTLSALRTVLADQVAGGARPEAALGHPLPFAVDGRAAAARLARRSLTTLRAGFGEQLAALVEQHRGPGLAAATRWLGAVEVEAHRWGVPLAPFPGLR